MRMLGNGFISHFTSAAAWWSNNGAISGCIAAYAPMGAVSLAASYVNKANPGVNDAALGVAPTWDVTNGWTFNGTTQYLTTGIASNTAHTMIVRFSNATGTTGCVAGANDASSFRFLIYPRYNGTFRLYGYSGLNTPATAQSSGVMAISNNNCYLNGSTDGTTTGSSINSLSIAIGGRNASGVMDTFYAGNVQALAIYSSALSSGEISTLTTIMNAL